MRITRLACITGSLFLVMASLVSFPKTVYALSVNVTPSEARIGESITVTGSDFPSNTQITIKFQENFLGSALTDSAGIFKLYTAVPSGHQPGAKIITASTFGGTSRTFQFGLLSASLNITPKEARTGDRVELLGYGGNYGAAAMVFLDSRIVEKTAITLNGTFQASFTLPEIPAGEHEIKMVDTIGHDSSPAKLIVKPAFQLSEPLQGKFESSILVRGTGFAANSDVKATFADTPETAAGWGWFAKTNENGTFTAGNAPVGEGTSGEHKVKVFDSKGNSEISGSTYRMLPGITLVEPRSGPVGSNITVHGKGFGAQEQGIVLYMGGAQIGTVNSNGLGSLSFNGQVPEISSGFWKISAQSSNNYETLFSYDFKIEPTLVLEPNNGPDGTRVTVKGMGFIPGTNNIVIKYDGNAVIPEQPVKSGDHGTFSGAFTVPQGYPGAHTISASDGKNEKTITWVMGKTISESLVVNANQDSQIPIIIPVTAFLGAGVLFSVIYVTRRPKSKEEKEQQAIIRQLKKEARQKQKEDENRITQQIRDLAQQNRGGVTMESVVNMCQIDSKAADKYFKKLKAHKDGDWYFIPEIEKTYR